MTTGFSAMLVLSLPTKWWFKRYQSSGIANWRETSNWRLQFFSRKASLS